MTSSLPHARSGITGLDDILGGGFTPNRLYLVEGMPGSGKTTLAFQFLLAGVQCGEAVLYVTLSETREEINAVAASHGWSLEGVSIRELVPTQGSLDPSEQYTVFHPSEVELSETTKKILDDVEQVKPARIVFDSLSELRLLAGHPLRYRRQILALKQYFAGRRCTVLLLDDLTSSDRDLQVQSIAHGALLLEQMMPPFGGTRRRLSITKYRGSDFRSGYHDYAIRRGGLEVYPRLVAAEHRRESTRQRLQSGLAGLDKLLGGGLERGTSTLIVGAAGTGKSTVSALFSAQAAERGEHAALFIFDESANTLFSRLDGLGIGLRKHVEAGRVSVRQIDPAELSPGEFVHAIRRAVQEGGATIVVIDSLNGFLNSMPDEKFLIIQLHELLAYLGQQGVATVLVAAHHGLIGAQMSAPVDASYLADAVLLMRYFEADGEVRQAISVVKMRGGEHERSIREFTMKGGRISVGEPLRDYRGVLTGVPEKNRFVSLLRSARQERRLLILAPVGKDAALMTAMLQKEEVDCATCPDLECLAREFENGAAAILVAEEALTEWEIRDGRLAGMIARQPPWSDLPVLLLTRAGADSAAVAWGLGALGNVTLLERPVRVKALASAVRSALRARRRQYLTRAHIIERERADRRKDEFLATLAHELRNPLAPIRNSVDMLRLSGAAEPVAEVWEMMDRQVSHMVRLVDDLMEVSRITRGKIELHKATLDLATVIAAALETSRPLVEAAQHALTVQLPARPLFVEADPMRLAQVFSNLINNAVKYTDPGGRISVAARREDGNAVVTVTDTGVGISAAALPNVFDMFVQVDALGSRAQSGLGIGLTLVRSLVEMHGGSAAAHSAGAGMGSEFEVRLPLAKNGAPRSSAAAAAVQEIHGLPRVLVVDDNQDAAVSLGAVLQALGADVRVAHDGEAALDTISAFRPAAVFLDIGMPGMDGYEVARRIRQRPDVKDTLLIALTGWGQEKDRRQTSAAGFNHHLVKPADVGKLQALLATISS